METIFRKWRVQPVKDGMKAPYSFVYTSEVKVWQAEKSAIKLATKNCRLSKLGWDIILTIV